MFEAEVALGATLLDEMEPGWERQIDLSDLELADPRRCVCGQLFIEQELLGAYDTGWQWMTHEILGSDRMGKYGFCLPLDASGETAGDWEDLTRAWVLLIKARFDSGTLSDA